MGTVGGVDSKNKAQAGIPRNGHFPLQSEVRLPFQRETQLCLGLKFQITVVFSKLFHSSLGSNILRVVK